MTDRGLIEQFVREHSEAAFSEIVERHSGLVYAVCLRDLDDSTLAEECAQAVFLILARKAKWLRGRRSIAGWLFKTARLAARDTLKQEIRRRKRETVIMENLQTQAEREAATWQSIEPELSDTLDGLPAGDREVLLMRFFDRFSHSEIADTLNIREDAARIRVSRAVDRLRRQLTKRLGAGAGVMAGVALADLLSNHAAQAMPEIVAKTLTLLGQSTTSLPAGLAVSGPHAHGIAQGAMKAMLRTTVLKWTAGAAMIAVVVIATSPMVAHAGLLLPGPQDVNVPKTPSTPPATNVPAGPSVGYTETYHFRSGGKEFGTQSATLTSQTPSGETWSFDLDLHPVANGAEQTVTEDLTASFSSTGFPLQMSLTADVLGGKQDASVDFTKQPVTMTGSANGSQLTMTVPYQPTQYLSNNDNISMLSIALRHMQRPAGKDLTFPIFSIDGPIAGSETWKWAGNEPLTVDGKSVGCAVYEMSSLDVGLSPAASQSQIGQRIWVDPSGSIVKLYLPSEKTTITRE